MSTDTPLALMYVPIIPPVQAAQHREPVLVPTPDSVMRPMVEALNRMTRGWRVREAVEAALGEWLTPATREYGIGYAARIVREDLEDGSALARPFVASVRAHFRKIEARDAR